MLYMKCPKCGKLYKNNEKKCNVCGLYLLEEIDISDSIYADSKNVFGFDAERDTLKLLELVAPAIENIDCAEKANKATYEYLSNISNYTIATYVNAPIKYVLLGVARSRDSYRDFQKKQNEFNLAVALNVYNKQMSKPVDGMGFGIITNDFASAASYLALSALNTNKQLVNREMAATKVLTEFLENCKSSNASNTMDDSDAFDLIDAIGEAMRVAEKMKQSYVFIKEHWDFYRNPEKYDLGDTLEGENIYNFLASSVTGNSFIKGSAEEETLYKFEAAGYIHRVNYCNEWRSKLRVVLEDTYFITTTRYEQEVLKKLYFCEHPEEEEKQKRIVEQQYARAEQNLKNKKYYEAAIGFGKLANYRDSAKRSFQIWRDFILKDGKWIIADHLYKNYAFARKEDGTVYALHTRRNPSMTFPSEWKNIAQLAASRDRICGLQDDGTLQMYCINNRTPAGNTDWKNLIKIFGGDSWTIVGLHSNGRVSVIGKDEDNQIYVDSWTNIKKVVNRYKSTAGLKDDGTVLFTGDDELCNLNYHSWHNIADIAVGSCDAVGLQKDGQIAAVSTKKDDENIMKSWSDIVRVKETDGRVFGFTSTGNLKTIDDYKTGKKFVEAQKNVADIVRFTGGYLVLHLDGTATAIGVQYDISNWTDLVSIDGNKDYAYGVKRDGTVLFAGKTRLDKTPLPEMKNWKLFEDINTVERDASSRIEKNIESQKALIRQQIQSLQEELGALKGLFVGKKRKQLRRQITELEADLDY